MKVPKQRETPHRKSEPSHSQIILAHSIIRPYAAYRTMSAWCEEECQRVYAGDPVELRRCLNECRTSGSFNF